MVGSGHNLLHGLLLRNITGRELQLATNGQVTAAVVDPHTGEVVGGFSGLENRPLIMFTVAPGQTGRIPLLIGTASCTPRLGYAIPPGDWGIYATLTLGSPLRDSPRRRTPVLPVTITAWTTAAPGDHRNCNLKLDTVLPGRPHLPCETPAQRAAPSQPSAGQDRRHWLRRRLQAIPAHQAHHLRSTHLGGSPR